MIVKKQTIASKKITQKMKILSNQKMLFQENLGILKAKTKIRIRIFNKMFSNNNKNDDQKQLLEENEFANDNIKKDYEKDENFEQPKNSVGQRPSRVREGDIFKWIRETFFSWVKK